jgi:cyclopropane-fatty-acyl-phospholipid synthase
MSLILKAMEWVWPGDFLVRTQIRKLNRARLAELEAGGVSAQVERKQQLIEQLRRSPRAICTTDANQQHYEVPADFYRIVLGQHLKYSCGYWPHGSSSIDESEQAMLELYVERAELRDGQEVLDLGCGWGSLSLFLAERFPNSSILGVSSSHSQRDSILSEARRRGLKNLDVWTCDVNQLELPLGYFDRVVSVEMLEHVRNYGEVLSLLRSSLKPEGKLFTHVFAHREHPYTFDSRGEGGLAGDWMEREFFSGGTMPSLDLFLHFQGDLRLEQQWVVPGWHYQRTANAWLSRLRHQKSAVVALFRQTYGRGWRKAWLGWQLFFLACAELFGADGGQQWVVHHQLWNLKEKR